MKTNHRRGFKANDRDRSRKKGDRGKELWSRRPGKVRGMQTSKLAKRITHQAERAEARRQLKREMP